MKGYVTAFGYMGWMPFLNCYKLFATEEEYKEQFELDLNGLVDDAFDRGYEQARRDFSFMY